MPERQPSLQQLTYFLPSVEHGSFAAAAQRLYIAQASLSDQIRRLEVVLGVRLFTRTNRRLQLTDAGRMVVPWARRCWRTSTPGNAATGRMAKAVPRSPSGGLGSPMRSRTGRSRSSTDRTSSGRPWSSVEGA